MNANELDLITLRAGIRSTRINMMKLHKAYRSDPKSIAGQEFERYAKLMEKYQEAHINRTGELY